MKDLPAPSELRAGLNYEAWHPLDSAKGGHSLAKILFLDLTLALASGWTALPLYAASKTWHGGTIVLGDPLSGTHELVRRCRAAIRRGHEPRDARLHDEQTDVLPPLQTMNARPTGMKSIHVICSIVAAATGAPGATTINSVNKFWTTGILQSQSR